MDSFFSKLKTSDLTLGLFDSKPRVNNLPEKNDLISDFQPVKISITGTFEQVNVSGCPEEGKLMWFRAPDGGELIELKIVDIGHELKELRKNEEKKNGHASLQDHWTRFVPTKEDVGARICAQWMSEDGLVSSNFAQIGPLSISNKVYHENVMENNDGKVDVSEEKFSAHHSIQQALENEIAKLKELKHADKLELERLQRVNVSLEKDLSSVKVQMVELKNERDGFLEDMNSMKITVKSVSEEASRLQKELEATKAQLLLHSLETQNGHNELLSAASKLAKLKEAEEAERFKNEDLEITLVEKQKLIDSLHEQLELIRNERKSLRVELGETQELLKSEKIKITQYESDLEVLRTRLSRETEHLKDMAYHKEQDAIQIQTGLSKQNELQLLVNSLRATTHQYADQEARLKQMSSDLQESKALCEHLIETEKELKVELDTATKSRDEMIAERNFYKRKSESQAHDFEKQLKSSQPHVRMDSSTKNLLPNNVNILRKADSVTSFSNDEYSKLLKSEAEAKSSAEFYRKALEEQIRRKQEEAKKDSDTRTDSQLQNQNKNLQQLANQYMETILDKDLQMDHLKKAMKMLGTRVQELESQLEIVRK